MSQYGIIYRMEFKNVEGFTIRVNISPTDILIPDADLPVIIPITGSGTPVIISASNDDEDKFTPIRSKSAKIQFKTNSAIGLDSSTFSQGGDNLWICDIILQDTPQYIFRGFLMMADNQQPFQPDPQRVTLTATDHLAALKEAAWQDLAGLNPIGKYRVADIINFCLRKTGMALSLFVVNNLRAGTGQQTVAATFANPHIITIPDTKGYYAGQRLVITNTVSNNINTIVSAVISSTQLTVSATLVNESAAAAIILDYNSQFHWYDKVYIDALTFEKEIGLSEDCYTVLEKILGEDCFITQWHGNWYIFRVDEMDAGPVYEAEFDPSGVYISTATDTIEKNIGRYELYKFANADELLRFVRPHDFVKETFQFDSPLENPCNIDFVRGALLTTVGNTKTYTLDCFDLLEGFPGAYGSLDGCTGYIERKFNDNGYETDRYIVLTPRNTNESGSSQPTYFQSKAIPVQVKDKFTSSIDLRLTSLDTGLSSMRLFRMVLFGDDGSYWILGRPSDTSGSDDTLTWYDTALWTLNTGKGKSIIDFANGDWQTLNWAAPPIPVSGNLYFWINQLNQNSASFDNHNVQYANLQFDYIAYINGTYQKYTGQYNKVNRTETGYIANRDKQVYISDSPTKIFKGAMFLFNNGAYVLFPVWFNAAPFGNTYPPDNTYLHPYGYIQAFSVWNQYKGYNNPTNGRGVGINIFSGSDKGLTDSWPDMLTKITLTDTNTQTTNRYFIMLSINQEWRACLWGSTLIEVFNAAIGKTYSDPFTFKLINQ